MSVPNYADLGVLSIKTADGPPVVFSVLCGLSNISINESISTSENFVRDCAKPNRPGLRKIRNQGYSFTISASGSDNVDLYDTYADSLGVRKTYQIDLRKDDGTDAGESLGIAGFEGIMTTRNRSVSDENTGQLEVTIEGEGEIDWVPAP